MKYAYDPRLPKAFSVGNINFQSRTVQHILKSGMKILRKIVRKRASPKGISTDILSFRMRDGYDLECFRIRPENTSGNLPCIFYCHGGAFMFPVQPAMLSKAAEYAKRLDCCVFIPEYRLTPDNTFPVPLNDCFDVLESIVSDPEGYTIDPERIILYGDSAGGCIAASLTKKLKEENFLFTPAGQMLIYPVTDDSMTFLSMEKYKDALWAKTANGHMWDLYLKNGIPYGMEHLAVPLKGDTFEGLPPAYIEAAEMDTLCDEAIAYADKLLDAGVMCKADIIRGAYHGFDSDLKNDVVKEIISKRCGIMEKMFSHIPFI